MENRKDIPPEVEQEIRQAAAEALEDGRVWDECSLVDWSAWDEALQTEAERIWLATPPRDEWRETAILEVRREAERLGWPERFHHAGTVWVRNATHLYSHAGYTLEHDEVGLVRALGVVVVPREE